jgi:hypothetical protein
VQHRTGLARGLPAVDAMKSPRATALRALCFLSAVPLAACTTNVVVEQGSGTGGTTTISTTTIGTTTIGTTTIGTTTIGTTTDTTTTTNPLAMCATPPKGPMSYGSEGPFEMAFVGQWLRCEGVIQPASGSPAPDGQDGLELEPGGGVDGLQSWELPIPEGGTGVLPWTGGLYEPVSWTFDISTGGAGVLFGGTTIPDSFDQPVFSNDGERMTLSGTLFPGHYVRYHP